MKNLITKVRKAFLDPAQEVFCTLYIYSSKRKIADLNIHSIYLYQGFLTRAVYRRSIAAYNTSYHRLFRLRAGSCVLVSPFSTAGCYIPTAAAHGISSVLKNLHSDLSQLVFACSLPAIIPSNSISKQNVPSLYCLQMATLLSLYFLSVCHSQLRQYPGLNGLFHGGITKCA